ncbi:MAG: NAD(P)/FAD-dependent oxidoreductase [Bacilli bacterium]|nr:NAD(P)/FAD-dependent oxidoreductase [Bacilli bacterium]
MKALIIGSGISGLMSASLLAKQGVEVIVFEQNQEIGGVTSLYKQNGYAWEQGQLLMGGYLPGEEIYEELQKIGITLDTVRGDRGIVLPDYDMWKPEIYQGPYWRRDRLIELFPEEKTGIMKYYQFTEIMETISNPKISKIRKAYLYLKIKKFANYSAEDLMDYFFKEEKIKTLFTGILADFCAVPKEFPGFAVPFLNEETAFDTRIPLEKNGKKFRKGYCYFKGGAEQLVKALEKVILENGGRIETGRTVTKILVSNSQVQGLILDDGEEVSAPLVIASGGGREVFFDLVGKEYLDDSYLKILEDFQPMESVFMVHLGVDFNPLLHQKAALCYYYKTYDIDGAIDRLRNGIYHNGNDGYLIYLPTFHSPEFAPENHHCVTIYTVAPDTLKEGSWEEQKVAFADRLIELAEEYLPGLKSHIKEIAIRTPIDYRKLAHLKKSAFGGVVPVRNKPNPTHETTINGLYFVGQQSENCGGVGNVITGAVTTFNKILKKYSLDK